MYAPPDENVLVGAPSDVPIAPHSSTWRSAYNAKHRMRHAASRTRAAFVYWSNALGDTSIAVAYSIAALLMVTVVLPLTRGMQNITAAAKDGSAAMYSLATAIADNATLFAFGGFIIGMLLALGYVLKMTSQIIASLHSFGNSAAIAANALTVAASLLIVAVSGVILFEINRTSDATHAEEWAASAPTPTIQAV